MKVKNSCSSCNVTIEFNGHKLMDEKVLTFARSIGYSTIKKIGKYNDKIVYKPKGNKSKITGFPKYIVVENENMELIIDSDLEISLHFYKDK